MRRCIGSTDSTALTRRLINEIACNIIALMTSDATMGGMSKREYSGLSRGVIQNAKRGGRLVFYVDGSINAAASEARRAGMTDRDQQRRSLGGDAAIPPSSGGGSDSYLKTCTALTVYQAQARRLAIQKKKGMLVDRARAEALVFHLARQERDVWVTWPARVAALMAAHVAAEVEKHQARPRQSTPGPCSASWRPLSANNWKRWLICGDRWAKCQPCSLWGGLNVRCDDMLI